MNDIKITPVKSRSDLNKFIKVVWLIYRNHPNWVPPLLYERKMLLDRKKNPFFNHSEMELFLAWKGGKVVGRVAAILNQNHNKFHNENIGFFGFFECINNEYVAIKLIERAKDWLSKKGVSAIRGPVNPSTNDDVGVLVKGFDKPPTVMMPYNPEYYEDLLIGAGLQKIKDLYCYYVHGDKVLSGKLSRVTNLIRQREKIKIRHLDMKSFSDELLRVKDIYNNAWSKNWGFVPMTGEEIDFLAEGLKQIVDPRLVIFAELEGKPIGFGLTLPDINQILIKNRKGRLIPGILRLMLNKKKINFVRIVVLGVLREYQRGGAGALLFYETTMRSINNGYYHGEAGWVLEDNVMMNRAAEFLNAERNKTYRIYESKI